MAFQILVGSLQTFTTTKTGRGRPVFQILVGSLQTSTITVPLDGYPFQILVGSLQTQSLRAPG